MTYPNLPRCRHCGDMLLSEFARSPHERVCTDNPNRETMPDERDIPAKPPQPYACSKCGAIFWSESARDGHQSGCTG